MTGIEIGLGVAVVVLLVRLLVASAEMRDRGRQVERLEKSRNHAHREVARLAPLISVGYYQRISYGLLPLSDHEVEKAVDFALKRSEERDRLLHLLKVSVASTPDAMETINTSIRKAKWLDKRQLVVLEDGTLVDMWLEKPGERTPDPEPEVYR